MKRATFDLDHIFYDKFSYDKFYFTGVNVSTSLLCFLKTFSG